MGYGQKSRDKKKKTQYAIVIFGVIAVALLAMWIWVSTSIQKTAVAAVPAVAGGVGAGGLARLLGRGA